MSDSAQTIEWVRSDERLPECDGYVEVLTCDPSGIVAAGDYWSEEKQFWPPNGKGEYWGSEWTDIVWWAYLPKGPQ